MSSAPIVFIAGASSKHDEGGASDDLPASTRFGLGGALALKFAEEGFNIVITARRVDVLEKLGDEVKKIQAEKGEGTRVMWVAMDVTNDDQVKAAFEKVQTISPFAADAFIDCLIWNCSAPFPAGFSFGADAPMPHELDVEHMNWSHDIAVGGLVRCSRHCLPGMLERKRGAILLTGATMQLRGGAEFGAVAPSKTALRSLGQTMYQAYAPKGIHVCNMTIDGVIDSAATRKWMAPEKLIPPEDIAGQFVAAYKQPPMVWSYEIMLTPMHSSTSVGMRM